MGWGGALVGCGSFFSRGVTGTVQMRSAGSVRFMRAGGRVSVFSVHFLFFGIFSFSEYFLFLKYSRIFPEVGGSFQLERKARAPTLEFAEALFTIPFINALS